MKNKNGIVVTVWFNLENKRRLKIMKVWNKQPLEMILGKKIKIVVCVCVVNSLKNLLMECLKVFFSLIIPG